MIEISLVDLIFPCSSVDSVAITIRLAAWNARRRAPTSKTSPFPFPPYYRQSTQEPRLFADHLHLKCCLMLFCDMVLIGTTW